MSRTFIRSGNMERVIRKMATTLTLTLCTGDDADVVRESLQGLCNDKELTVFFTLGDVFAPTTVSAYRAWSAVAADFERNARVLAVCRDNPWAVAQWKKGVDDADAEGERPAPLDVICDASKALTRQFHLPDAPQNCVLVLGPGCSPLYRLTQTQTLGYSLDGVKDALRGLVRLQSLNARESVARFTRGGSVGRSIHVLPSGFKIADVASVEVSEAAFGCDDSESDASSAESDGESMREAMCRGPSGREPYGRASRLFSRGQCGSTRGSVRGSALDRAAAALSPDANSALSMHDETDFDDHSVSETSARPARDTGEAGTPRRDDGDGFDCQELEEVATPEQMAMFAEIQRRFGSTRR